VNTDRPPTPAQAVAETLDRLVLEAARDECASFAALVRAAGLDPGNDFVGASLRDLDFRDEDLRGFDFSYADLTGTDFRRANLAGVRFDGAFITGAIGLPQVGNGHLSDFAVFSDAPFAPELVVIPAGEFTMGSFEAPEEQPPRKVTIGHRMAIGRYPVTFDEYDRFCSATGRQPSEELRAVRERGRRPVVYVSWFDARDYLKWLSSETRRRYRLPTEAEWEYACRAGIGDAVPAQHINCRGGGPGHTTEVGSYGGNLWNLHDMLGNVLEWTKDGWHANYRGAPDNGSAWSSAGSLRVVRGGSFRKYAVDCQPARRDRIERATQSDDTGFRVARMLEP